jgi:hypothetical protein
MRLALVEPLVRRSRQIVRAYPAAAGPSVKPREIVRAVRSCRLGCCQSGSRLLLSEAQSVSRGGRELSVDTVPGCVPECTDRRPGSHSVGHSAASSRTPRSCARSVPGWERLWINTERQPAEVVALFDAVYILRRLIPSMSSTADGDLPIVVRARCDQDQ